MSASEETRKTSVIKQQLKRSSYTHKSRELLEDIAVKENHIEELEKLNKFKRILKDIYQKEFAHQDDRDVSLQPSYSKFQLPYYIKCRNRYSASKKFYEQRFQYEIQQLIAQQPTGYEAARLNRHLCITTIWPPLHSLREIAHTQRYFFSLTHKERQRLNWIMTTKII